MLRLPLWTTVGFSWIDISVTQSRSCSMGPTVLTCLQRMLSGNTVSAYQIYCFWNEQTVDLGLILLSWEQLSICASGIRTASVERLGRLSGRSSVGCSRTRPDFHCLSVNSFVFLLQNVPDRKSNECMVHRGALCRPSESVGLLLSLSLLSVYFEQRIGTHEQKVFLYHKTLFKLRENTEFVEREILTKLAHKHPTLNN